jgi:hypothetical protein
MLFFYKDINRNDFVLGEKSFEVNFSNGMLPSRQLHSFILKSLFMKLITKELRKRIPPLYSKKRLKIQLFMQSTSLQTLIGLGMFWSLTVKIHSSVVLMDCILEIGYFSLSELEKIRGPLGLKVERDLYWKPKPLSEVKKEVIARQGEKNNKQKFVT